MQRYFERVYQPIRHFWTLTEFCATLTGHHDIELKSKFLKSNKINRLFNLRYIDGCYVFPYRSPLQS